MPIKMLKKTRENFKDSIFVFGMKDVTNVTSKTKLHA